MLFQKNIIKKYISSLDEEDVQNAWNCFKKYFQNPDIQQNIRQSKEEQFQEGFLRELFVKVFGYTLHPSPNYNLVTEKKNETNAQKADGAIVIDGNVIGVIELKDTKTTDLSKIEAQAFGYKNKHSNCRIVIISNFEKLRLYIDNAVDYKEWNIFDITFEDFKELYLALSYANLGKNVALKMKDDSISNEEQITKRLYKDYSDFKRDLYDDILKNWNAGNPSAGEPSSEQKLRLYKKTQKLLDRFLFIFFAEDCGILPPNFMNKIIREWKTLAELDEYRPLYDRIKKNFGYIDTGYKRKDFEVYAYDGGLFIPDEELDNLKISDDILEKYTTKMSLYDYESEVDVNILGHIFEHSLNENGSDKRKSDGVFYTPQYITKYIIDNTVGKLCSAKKNELGIKEDDYFADKKRRKEAKKLLYEKLDAYRKWLLQITILDPACGSGAFLNAALVYLIQEHKLIDEMEAKITGDSLVMPNIEISILENNLFGVDINEESVEIAKLSLWLRTAKPKRKLNSLNHNIKCGNSLIDDPSIAGEKAFDWKKEFPQVFEKGGFDVVIGNPPYVRQELIQEQIPALNKYIVYTGKADLYTYFYERAEMLLREKGLLGFICSGKFFEANYGKALADFLFERYKFLQIIDYDDLEVFEGVTAYPLIFIAEKNWHKKDSYVFNYCYVPSCQFDTLEEVTSNLPFVQIDSEIFSKSNYKFLSKQDYDIMEKLSKNSVHLNDIGLTPLVGIKTGFNEGYITQKSENEHIKPYIFGKNIKKYSVLKPDTNIVFPYISTNEGYVLVDSDCEELNLLNQHKAQLQQRAIIKEGLNTGTKVWYEYQQINKKLDFSKEYIVYPNVSLGANFTLSKGNVIDMTGFIIPTNDKYLLAVLNSKVAVYVMNRIAISRRGGYKEYKVQYLNQIPIKIIDDSSQQPFIILADKMLDLNAKLQAKVTKFISRIKESFNVQKTTQTIELFYTLDFKALIREFEKQKIKLSLANKDELEAYFDSFKAECVSIKKEIEDTDKEIDRMVCELYGVNLETIAENPN